VTLTGLWSNDLEWGLKYGFGSSTLHGPDEDYVYRYDFYLDESLMQDLGSVSVRSDENDSGLAHNAGVYANIILTRKTIRYAWARNCSGSVITIRIVSRMPV
jgi:hypothetical protein